MHGLDGAGVDDASGGELRHAGGRARAEQATRRIDARARRRWSAATARDLLLPARSERGPDGQPVLRHRQRAEPLRRRAARRDAELSGGGLRRSHRRGRHWPPSPNGTNGTATHDFRVSSTAHKRNKE